MVRRVENQAVVELAVDIQEVCAEAPQDCRRHQRAVDQARGLADVVDAVKHSDRSKKIFWEKPAENIMADIDSKKFEYFVRTTDSAENVQKIFGKCEFVDNIIDNESAFVTSPLTKSEVEEKLAKLSDVVANIRVMD